MTAVHAALGYRFTVTCTDQRLQAHVDQMLAGLAVTDDHGGHDHRIDRYTVDTREPGPFALRLDGEVLVSSASPADPLAHLLHQVNLRAVEHSDHLTLLHAAAACAPAGPVVFPAAMESGKSTLVTALALRGWPYVTDEILALRSSGEVVPYPRAISLDPGSWTMFPDLRPAPDPGVAPLLPNQWQVSVPSAGGRVADSPAGPASVVFPSYTPGQHSRLEPITPLAGLHRLLGTTFRLERHPQRDLSVLAALVDARPCYLLAVGELGGACDLLEEEFGKAETHAPAGVTVSFGHDDQTRLGGRRFRQSGALVTADEVGGALVVHRARRT